MPLWLGLVEYWRSELDFKFGGSYYIYYIFVFVNWIMTFLSRSGVKIFEIKSQFKPNALKSRNANNYSRLWNNFNFIISKSYIEISSILEIYLSYKISSANFHFYCDINLEISENCEVDCNYPSKNSHGWRKAPREIFKSLWAVKIYENIHNSSLKISVDSAHFVTPYACNFSR